MERKCAPLNNDVQQERTSGKLEHLRNLKDDPAVSELKDLGKWSFYKSIV